MLTLARNRAVHRAEGREQFRNRTWLRILVRFGLGGMIVTVLCLLSGCGSDSKPQAVSGKKEKTAAGPKAMNPRAGLPIMNLDEVAGRGTVRREPVVDRKAEILPGAGVTIEEVEERVAAARKRTESPTYEILPGITKQELDAKIAANQNEQKRRESANDEIFPGITRAELKDKIAADRKKEESGHEVFPGITMDELDAKTRAGKE